VPTRGVPKRTDAAGAGGSLRDDHGMPIEDEPSAHGGLVATFELHARGYGRAAIAAAVRTDRIRRVRQGWYSSRDLAPVLARAARVGGVATCATALAAAGVWVLPDARLHVGVMPTACQLRSPRDSRARLAGTEVIVHWSLARQPSRILRALPESIVDYAGCASPELVAAAANSLLREHPEYRTYSPGISALLPVRMRPWLALVDGVCESGTEFLFWSRSPRVRELGRRQVWIPGVGRVDFLVGERLVIEIDGYEFHGDRDKFEADRSRDARLSSLGYRCLRFSHRMVLEDWQTVEAAVFGAIARGDHL